MVRRGLSGAEASIAARLRRDEAGVVGMPDPELGERVRAYVALKAGREAMRPS
jgi:acyl-coenzyme A synthetase/AMP-(fatty) acid ligase